MIVVAKDQEWPTHTIVIDGVLRLVRKTVRDLTQHAAAFQAATKGIHPTHILMHPSIRAHLVEEAGPMLVFSRGKEPVEDKFLGMSVRWVTDGHQLELLTDIA